MKIAAVEATPLAIPLAQEFHWAGGAQVGANLVLFAVHTDEGVTGYGESVCEDPAAVVAYGELMARQLIGRSPGDMEGILRSIWTHGRWKMFPQFTQLDVRGHRGRLLGRARPRARRADARRSSAGAVQDELDYFGFLQGDDPETLARARRELAGEGYGVIYLKVGRGAARRRRLRRRRARGDRARAEAPDRPERGLGLATAVERIRRLEALRPRLGRAADAGRRRQRPRARAPLGGRQDRRRPGGVHDGAAPARAREGGGGRRRPGEPRRRRAAPLPPAGVSSARPTA